MRWRTASGADVLCMPPSPTLLSTPVPLPRSGQSRAYWRAPASASALAVAIASAATQHAAPLLVVARNNHTAHQLEADLHTLLGGAATLPVLNFPDWETLPYDRFSPHPDIVSQRLATLARLPGLTRGIVVVPVATLMQRARAARPRDRQPVRSRLGQRLDLDAEKRRLDSAGYRNVPQVFDPGDFAVRGGLLDVYPMGADAPFRIELLDDEIDIDPRVRPGIAALAGQDRAHRAAARPRGPARRGPRSSARWMRCATASTSTPAAAPWCRT